MTTRDALVDAATELIASDGLAALSLRKVAEQVGIRAPSIYVHFGSKEALLAEARLRATRALGAHLRAARKGGDARARLLVTATAYLGFARAQPSLFALLFMELPSERRSLDEAPDADSPYRLLLDAAAEFLGGDRRAAEMLSFGIWSTVHGAAVLWQTHLRDFSGPIDAGLRENLERLLDGWRPRAAPPAAGRRPRKSGDRP